NDMVIRGDVVIVTGLASISLVIMPATVIFSLNMEVHELAMFLYRKQTIAKLIHIKFLHGFIYSVIYFFVTLLVAYTLKLFNRLSFNLSDFFQAFGFTIIDLGIISIMASIFLYTAWVFHQWLKHKLGFSLSMLIIITAIYFSQYIIPLIDEYLSYFSGLWRVKYYESIDSNQQILEQEYISISYIIAIFVLLFLLYFLVTWFLKKKVEV
ncbi:hypothetical protein, partial [Gracilibacillus oryzae]|uniref:hypothetical protein n=1 Tax=Gracilibacillus oryzae TaxID=1672701 RepID=UPI0018862860